ncbi:MOSC domain-containing protein [Streptomyces sp. UH6]|uniref:MOSC domain-containing protein n=1 Tax=Streptomyces sp. UH6 TaxID=2748379 RepID=UPI0015D48686|nr:MOSC domain-containing protein [Streptomyces sp. UH6]NYV72782.1 MOSC domain-containing protein [Streptomyces sp. UH6]
MGIGSLARLEVTATKGFALRVVPEIQVESTGIVGNREFFLVDIDERLYSVPRDPIFLDHWTSYDPASGTFAVGRGERTECAQALEPAGGARPFHLDDRTVQGRWAPGPWDEYLSEIAGRALRLVHCTDPGGGHDAYPVTLQSTASLAALGTETDGQPVDPRRFRLNVTADLGDVPFEEDGWNNRVLQIGECQLRVREGIPRCLAVEHRPRDGDRALRMQARIRSVRGATPSAWGPAVLFGVYADVVRPGRITMTDPVHLLP